MTKEKIVIVGGVAGGATAAARARRLSETAEIIIIEKGPYISFANCGLPYYIGGIISDKDRLLLQTPAAMRKRFGIDARTGHEVTALHPSKKTVTVTDLASGKTYQETYTKLILATGAIPFIPPIAGLEDVEHYVLRDIPDSDRIKTLVDSGLAHHVLIVGAGAISLELAENLITKGSAVTIVEASGHVLPQLDLEIARIMETELRAKGITLHLGASLQSVGSDGGRVLATLANGETISADTLVLVAGIRPNTALAKAAHITLDERGLIVTDTRLRTSVKTIFAVGDSIAIRELVSGSRVNIALAGPANKQARVAAANALGGDEAYSGALATAIVSAFGLAAASTGLSSFQLEKNGQEFSQTIIHSTSHAGYYPAAMPLTVKLLFGKNGEIFGAQAIGREGADKRIDVIATAMRGRMDVHDLARLDLAYSPPYSSAKDPVNMVAFTAENILSGLMKPFSHSQLPSLTPQDVLLDVRTPEEFDLGAIKGAVNMPVDGLRENLHTLPKSKKLYVYCASGQRSYLAGRILAQRGFDCYNLIGGYHTYKDVYLQEPTAAAPTQSSEQSLAAAPIQTLTVPTDSEITVTLDTCGLSCPGPLHKVFETAKKLNPGDTIKVTATDPAFASDIVAWCDRTGNTLLQQSTDDGIITAILRKGPATHAIHIDHAENNAKTFIIFSDDIDKVIASFILANGGVSMGRDVTMFFTFWGLNVLRKPGSVPIQKDPISQVFGLMMPKGSKHLHLSQMNMGGMGTSLIRWLMIKKNIGTLETLIQQARDGGVHMIACSTSMDIMGIKKEELIDGIEIGGVASYYNAAERADTNLFI